MALEPAFLALMNQQVTVEPFASSNMYGEPAFGDAVTMQARIEGRPQMVRTATGEERVASAVVYVDSTPVVSPRDRVTLPDGSTPLVLSVIEMPDERGPHHQAIYLATQRVT